MRWSNESNFPQGGWYYLTPEGLKIKRSNLRLLIAAVSEHYAGLGGTVDAEQLVHTQLCERHPHLCGNPKPAPAKAPASPGGGSPLFRLASAHIDRVFRAQPAPAHDSLVTRRLTACAQCPAARSVDSVGCSRCVTALQTARRGLGAKLDWVPAPLCSALGVDCFAAARFGILRPEPAESRLPGGCWVTQRNFDPTHDDGTLDS